MLDWELSTLGDPLSDLAYLCMPYHFASSPGGRAGFPSFHGGVVPEGVPSERELRALYFRHRGRPDPYAERGEGGGGGVAPWGFYLALSMFRMAAILQARGGRDWDGAPYRAAAALLRPRGWANAAGVSSHSVCVCAPPRAGRGGARRRWERVVHRRRQGARGAAAQEAHQIAAELLRAWCD